MLGTTSRTLRFYEEQGVISSTYITDSIQRKYTTEQISHIKNVIISRKLGLSVNNIKELLNDNIDLTTAIYGKRALVLAQIKTKSQELRLLEEALCIIHNGGDIYKINTEIPFNNPKNIISDIAVKCTELLLSGNLESCYELFSTQLTDYIPLSVLKKAWYDVHIPLGKFIFIEDKTIVDNIVLHFIKYEKLGLKVKYVFNDRKISGLWFDYYEMK